MFSLVIHGGGKSAMFSLVSLHHGGVTELGIFLAVSMPSLALFSLVLCIQVSCWVAGHCLVLGGLWGLFSLVFGSQGWFAQFYLWSVAAQSAFFLDFSYLLMS